ncbi:MAG: HAD-IIIA family hydrolase [Thermococci archaeon]|nr:HAD-IIIA family hydrolase [Thermococci archaeon]
MAGGVSVAVEAVLFDIDHTLLTEDPLIMLFLPWVYSDMARRMGVTKEEARNMFLGEVMRRRGTYEWHDWNFFFRLFGVRLRYEEILRRYPQKLIVYREVPQVLKTLKDRGYKLGVITSGPAYQRLKLKLTGLERYFDVVVTREDAGAIKPEPRTFLLALEKLNVKPQNAAMVGDSLSQDVYGAKNVGMLAVWVNRRGEPGYHLPDVEVQNLSELVPYLGV